MGKHRQKIYWDSCIFIAWIHDEPLDVSIMAGIEEIVKQVDSKEITLITSVVTRTELLESKMSSAVRKRCDDLFNRRNVVMVDLDRRISDLSHEIRSYYDRKGIMLGSADCQHVATAIQYDADEFHTLDGSGKRKKGTIIQTLTGKIAGKYSLNILVPRSTPGPLFDEPQKAIIGASGQKLLAPAPSASTTNGDAKGEAKDENDNAQGNGQKPVEEESIKPKPSGDGAIGIPELPATSQEAHLSAQSGDSTDQASPPIEV